MALIIYILCTGFIKLSAAQIATSNGQGAGNTAFSILRNAQSNSKSLNSNTLLASQPYHLISQNLGAVPATNFVRNLASGNGFTNFATGNIANSNSNVANLRKTNSIPNTNTATQNFASNLASANAAVGNLDVINLNKPDLVNIAGVANSNSRYSGFANQAPPSTSGNIANSMASRYMTSPYTQSYGAPYANNFASNVASGNMASYNRQAGWNTNLAPEYSYPGPALPNGQHYGIFVQSDGLEIGGNVDITGNMPIYGTVSLNGNLSTGGAASVNYACSG